MSVDRTRHGAALTRQFRPVGYKDDLAVRRCEDLAQQFTDLYDNILCDDELLGLFQKADDAIAPLITEIYKRTEADR